MKKLIGFGFALSLLVFLVASCKKEENAINTTTQQVSEDVSELETLVQDAEDEAEVMVELRSGSPSNECPTVTMSNTAGSFPNDITVDFGTEGCVGADGRVRKGKVLITISDNLTNEGAVRTVTLEDYYVNDIHLEGMRTLTNTGLNDDGNPTFSRVVTDGAVTFTDGSNATWAGTHTIEQVGGAATLTVLDNIFEINGNANGVNRQGKAWTSEITEPLTRRVPCRFVVSGIRSITVDGHTATLDYGFGLGAGDCDRQALLTLPNGDTRIILVRH